MVWGMTSFRWLSDLHIIPRDQTVMADYFVEGLLKKTETSAVCYAAEERNWPQIKIEAIPDISESVFQQYGALAHWAKKTQERCRTNFPDF